MSGYDPPAFHCSQQIPVHMGMRPEWNGNRTTIRDNSEIGVSLCSNTAITTLLARRV